MRFNITRRALLTSAAATALVPMAALAETTAETIYTGGPILTIDDANPRAEAVAVASGRILR